jgi:hypothetical protein
MTVPLTFNIPEILELLETSKQQIFLQFPKFDTSFKSVEFKINTNDTSSNILYIWIDTILNNECMISILMQLNVLEAKSNVVINIKLQKILQDIVKQELGLNIPISAESTFENWFKCIDNHIPVAGMTREYSARLLFSAGYYTALNNQTELDKITGEFNKVKKCT